MPSQTLEARKACASQACGSSQSRTVFEEQAVFQSCLVGLHHTWQSLAFMVISPCGAVLQFIIPFVVVVRSVSQRFSQHGFSPLDRKCPPLAGRGEDNRGRVWGARVGLDPKRGALVVQTLEGGASSHAHVRTCATLRLSAVERRACEAEVRT